MRILVLLAIGLAAVSAVPANPQRIVGGSVTTIDNYPTIAALLYTYNWNSWIQTCGSIILNNRAILTAAHCTFRDENARWRVRVGSTFGNSGGVVHLFNRQIVHPNFVRATLESDLAILHTSTVISFNNVVQPASIAGSNYNLADNQVVWAAGWGATFSSGWNMEQLRHVQVWTINQATCRSRYATRGDVVSDNMLCSGWLDVGGRDQCQGDSGGPLYHNRVVVGITSWGRGCGDPFFPGVNVRVSRFTAWIQSNA